MERMVPGSRADRIEAGSARSSVEATRTYLAMESRESLRPASGNFPELRIEPLDPARVGLYRELYRSVGKNHHWRDRWNWSDAEIRAHLLREDVCVFVAHRGAQPVGYYELRREKAGNVEIAYFGLVPETVGHGLGKHLLTHAIRAAWDMGATGVWLHTCSLDHPHALPNYLARGFTVTRTERVDAPVARTL